MYCCLIEFAHTIPLFLCVCLSVRCLSMSIPRALYAERSELFPDGEIDSTEESGRGFSGAELSGSAFLVGRSHYFFCYVDIT